MERHHYLGFRQFAGRGLRQVAEWRGQWLALVGWPGRSSAGYGIGGWGAHRSVQFRRLHLIGNNTRYCRRQRGFEPGVAGAGAESAASERGLGGRTGMGWSWRRRLWTRRDFTAGCTTPRTGCGWGGRRDLRGTTGRIPHKESKEMFVRARGVGRGSGWRTRRTARSGTVTNVLHEGGVAVVAGLVGTDAGLPPWSGAQAPAGDGAGDLRPGAVVGAERAGGDGTVRADT